jgi:inosine-uridine nucleoside N-ribohydrolase
MTPTRSIFIDADNGLGSPSGDVDDGFAIAALIKAGAPIAGVAAVGGNTREELAFANNTTLCRLLGFEGPLLDGKQARDFLPSFTGRIAAMGPFTNCVGARSAAEIVAVGTTLNTSGKWPPFWPYEFNFTKDKESALKVFRLDVPLTIFPLDIVRQLYVHQAGLDAIPDPFGSFARRETKRWFRHLLLLRQTTRFPIYDLAAALYLLGTDGMTMADTVAEMRPNTFVEFGRGSRPVKVCTAIRRERLWQRFLSLFA